MCQVYNQANFIFVHSFIELHISTKHSNNLWDTPRAVALLCFFYRVCRKNSPPTNLPVGSWWYWITRPIVVEADRQRGVRRAVEPRLQEWFEQQWLVPEGLLTALFTQDNFQISVYTYSDLFFDSMYSFCRCFLSTWSSVQNLFLWFNVTRSPDWPSNKYNLESDYLCFGLQGLVILF